MIKLTVESLYGGGAVERFHGELEKAIANIVDPNTPAKKPRKVKLEMIIKPNEHRNMNDGVKFALVEADGGAWKGEAMKNIKAFMKENVPGLNVIA